MHTSSHAYAHPSTCVHPHTYTPVHTHTCAHGHTSRPSCASAHVLQVQVSAPAGAGPVPTGCWTDKAVSDSPNTLIVILNLYQQLFEKKNPSRFFLVPPPRTKKIIGSEEKSASQENAKVPKYFSPPCDSTSGGFSHVFHLDIRFLPRERQALVPPRQGDTN